MELRKALAMFVCCCRRSLELKQGQSLIVSSAIVEE